MQTFITRWLDQRPALSAMAWACWLVLPLFAEGQLQISNKPLQPSYDRATGQTEILVEVVNSSGQGVYDLGEANFEVALDGRPVRGVRVGRRAGELSVVVAIDVSGSMQGAGIAAAKAAAVQFIERLGPESSCALLLFGERVQANEFTPDKGTLRQQIEAIRATDRKTRLYQALYEALDKAAYAPGSRAAIVLVTDGRDVGSELGLEDVVTKTIASRVPIYALGYGNQVDEKVLRRLATVSRGAYYHSPDPQRLAGLYLALADQLNKTNRYLLSFQVPSFKGQKRVTVTVKHRGQAAQAEAVLAAPAAGKPAWVWGALVLGGLLLLAAAGWLVWRRYGFGRFADRGTVVLQPSSQARAWLEVISGPHTGERFPLRDGAEIVVGRISKYSHFCLRDDPQVSRKHFRITQNEEKQFVIEDLGSRNKTWVNDEPLTEPLVLQNNDRIRAGVSELMFLEAQ